jgi:hypothetical protein
VFPRCVTSEAETSPPIFTASIGAVTLAFAAVVRWSLIVYVRVTSAGSKPHLCAFAPSSAAFKAATDAFTASFNVTGSPGFLNAAQPDNVIKSRAMLRLLSFIIAFHHSSVYPNGEADFSGEFAQKTQLPANHAKKRE